MSAPRPGAEERAAADAHGALPPLIALHGRAARPGDYFSPVYKPTRAALWLFYNANGGVWTRGRENIPASGPVIVAPNHVSHTDPPLIPVTNRRPVTIMAKEELFDIPLLGSYIAALGTFPVKRGTADRAALRGAMERLALGRVLLIFPEGTRGDGARLQEPERGLGLLATRSGAPVVPTYIHNTLAMMPRGSSRIHRARVGVIYGRPIRPQEYTGKGAGDRLARDVMAAIARLRDEYLAESSGSAAATTR